MSTPPSPLTNPTGGGNEPPPVDPAVQRLQTDLRNKDAELRTLRERLTLHTAQPNQQQQPPPPNVDMKRVNADFLSNPVQSSAAIAESVARSILGSPQAQQGFETQVMMAEKLVRDKDPETYDKYALEIQTRMTTVDPQFRTNASMWQTAFNLVKGEHFGDEIKALKDPANRAPAVHISRGEGPASSSPRPGPAPQVVALTDEEKYAAKKFGISEDRYRAAKERLEKADPMGKPSKPSAFDDMITFSSKDKRRKERDARAAAAAKK